MEGLQSHLGPRLPYALRAKGPNSGPCASQDRSANDMSGDILDNETLVLSYCVWRMTLITPGFLLLHNNLVVVPELNDMALLDLMVMKSSKKQDHHAID